MLEAAVERKQLISETGLFYPPGRERMFKKPAVTMKVEASTKVDSVEPKDVSDLKLKKFLFKDLVSGKTTAAGLASMLDRFFSVTVLESVARKKGPSQR